MTPAPAPRPGVIAVFGGMFDPPHWGHIRAAEAVRDRMGVEAVWLMPARVPPHRKAPERLPQERLALVRAAVRGRERLVASGFELERPGPSFTVDSLDRLAAARPAPRPPEASLLFVTGTDAFREIRTWSRYEELLERHPALVVRRVGYPLAEAIAALPARFSGRVTADLEAPLLPPIIFTMEIPLPDPASEDLRRRLRAGQPVREDLPPPVFERIESLGHYR